MTQLTAAERLAKVKTALGISGDYQDDTLTFYIDEVIEELVDAGVARSIAESSAAVGCIALGVNDLWNYSSGGVKHSEQFNRRLIQLSLKESDAVTPRERHERIVTEQLTNTVQFSLQYSDDSVIRIFTNGLLEVVNVDYTIDGNVITFNGMKIAGTEIDIYIYD